MNLNTKRTTCLLIAIASALTIVGSVTYAYFTGSASITTPQQASINTGTMRVTFADRGEGIDEVLNFGDSVTKKFTIINTGTLESSIKINFVDLINTYIDGSLTYTLSYSETENGVYKEIISKTNIPVSETPKKITLAPKITLPVGATYYYNLVIKLNYLEDVNQDSDLNAKFSTKFDAEDANAGESNDPSIIDSIIASSKGVRTDFDSPATTDEGIFEMEDDYGTSYYFRGAVENNYVKFGKNAKSQDMYWRIIRINGNGSLRIMYTGTQAYANRIGDDDMFIEINKRWNSTSVDTKYVGWMYNPAGSTASTSKEEAQTNVVDSEIKTIVDKWYKTNIIDTGYSNAVADVLFCNDRSTPGKDITNWEYDTGLGYGTNFTAYGAYARIGAWGSTKPSAPTFKCPQKNDAFTVSDTQVGNGDLTYPVGLITADEIIAAGSGRAETENDQYYLYRPSYHYSSFSPHNYHDFIGATIIYISSHGYLSNNDVSYPMGIAPSINLSAEYANTLIGTGTINDPYRTPDTTP